MGNFGFTTDYDNAQSGGILPEETFEMVVKAAYEDTTKNTGKVYISIPLVVRNDIEQKYKNAYLWHAMWKRKEPTSADLSCGGYSKAQIDTLSKALNLGNGKSYKSLEEWLNDLKGRPVRVTIKHELDQNSKPRASVNYFEQTKAPDCKHVFKTSATAQSDISFGPEITVDDDSLLPF